MAAQQQRKVVHTDVKLNNKPELATRFLDVPNMAWEATKFPGIQIKVLYSDDDGRTTALFKLAPGAVVPLHEHTALEQTYVLEGSLEDHEGVCGPGQFCWRPAGNQHEAAALNGALILGFFLKPNRFAYGEKFFTEERTKIDRRSYATASFKYWTPTRPPSLRCAPLRRPPSPFGGGIRAARTHRHKL